MLLHYLKQAKRDALGCFALFSHDRAVDSLALK